MKKKLSIIFLFSIAVAIILLIMIFIFIKFSLQKKEKSVEEIPVTLIKVESEKIKPTLETFGTVIYKTKNEITSLVSGNVISKKIKEGDFVKRNQELYRLKNVELEIQHSQYLNNLNSAKANLNLFQVKLKENKQAVKSQILQIENKKLEISQLENTIKSTNEKFQKSIGLNELGGITNQSIKDMEDENFNLQTSLKILKKELEIISIGFTKNDLINEGIVPSENKEIFTNQIIELNTKSSHADLKVAEAEFENAKKNVIFVEKLLNDLIIKSPIEGIVGATYFEEGEFVNQNEKVLMIMDTSTCLASMNIQENNIFDISIGSKTSIEIPSVKKIYESTVTEISPFADSSTGLFNIKSNFSNNENLIKPGMFLRCTIQNEKSQEYIKIPESALINISDKNAECFYVKNNFAILQKINIEFIKNGTAFLKNGLEKNQLIINEPSSKLKEGSRVKIL